MTATHYLNVFFAWPKLSNDLRKSNRQYVLDIRGYKIQNCVVTAQCELWLKSTCHIFLTGSIAITNYVDGNDNNECNIISKQQSTVASIVNNDLIAKHLYIFLSDVFIRKKMHAKYVSY